MKATQISFTWNRFMTAKQNVTRYLFKSVSKKLRSATFEQFLLRHYAATFSEKTNSSIQEVGYSEHQRIITGRILRISEVFLAHQLTFSTAAHRNKMTLSEDLSSITSTKFRNH